VAVSENRIEVGNLTWFYREAQPTGASDRTPVVLLHGIPAQSYSWREVLPALSAQGFRAIAPDWIGSGFSTQPDRRDFAYTPTAFLQGLEAFLQALELEKFSLVVQGFLGTVGVQYALQHPEQIDRLAILNAPITTTAKLPWNLKQLGVPLVGEMLTQDPLLVDRALEGAGGYRVEDGDLDVYRRPFLKSSDAGRALFTTIRNLHVQETTAEIETGLQAWTRPLLLAWGDRDPWLPPTLVQQFAQSQPQAELVLLEETGHYPQEDWPEKVSATLLTFLRRRVL